MQRTLYANLIERIAFFTGENIANIEFYFQGLLPKILAIYQRDFCLVHSPQETMQKLHGYASSKNREQGNGKQIQKR